MLVQDCYKWLRWFVLDRALLLVLILMVAAILVYCFTALTVTSLAMTTNCSAQSTTGSERMGTITTPMNLRNMTHTECLSMLEGAHYGHLACCSEGQPYVVPIYFAFHARVAYSFSMPGRKVEWMRQDPRVCL
jgi:Na+/glutamate symporter